VGKLINLSDLLVHAPLTGQVGHRPYPLGHAWRAHRNQCPPPPAGAVMVVHNGIIENFRTLRAELAAAGLVHESDTDTETIAHFDTANIWNRA
jgi:glutamine---fructose-6-phosphate transaminase (isomerizing)